MTRIAPSAPVLVGVARKVIRGKALPGPEPLENWRDVCVAAVQDAGLDADALSKVDSLTICDCMTWRYDDPTGRLADMLGADPAVRWMGPPSGTSGQTLVNQAADRIRNGESQLELRPKS